MSFAGILREIVEGCGGGIGAALMGNDGIAIEQVTTVQQEDAPVGEEIATAGPSSGASSRRSARPRMPWRVAP